jgi:hypothetical protein
MRSKVGLLKQFFSERDALDWAFFGCLALILAGSFIILVANGLKDAIFAFGVMLMIVVPIFGAMRLLVWLGGIVGGWIGLGGRKCLKKT